MMHDVKTFRLAHHFTQQQMADNLGIKKSTISMVETGKRNLPREARHKFMKLQQRALDSTQPAPALVSEDFLKEMKAELHHNAEKYIHTYIRDLQTEQHRLEKQLESWTEKFNKAASALRLLEWRFHGVETGQLTEKKEIMMIQRQRVVAEESLLGISRQKPEIALIRLAGIKKELAEAKVMLGKHRRFPVIDTITLSAEKPDYQKKIGTQNEAGNILTLGDGKTAL